MVKYQVPNCFGQKWGGTGTAYARAAKKDVVKEKGDSSLPSVNLADWKIVPVVKSAVSKVDVASLI